jgi:hypothetical protein
LGFFFAIFFFFFFFFFFFVVNTDTIFYEKKKKKYNPPFRSAENDGTAAVADGSDSTAPRSHRPSGEGGPGIPMPLENKTVLICGVDEYTVPLARRLSQLGAVIVVSAVLTKAPDACEEELSALSKEITQQNRQIFRHDVDVAVDERKHESARSAEPGVPDDGFGVNDRAAGLFKWAKSRTKTIDYVVISVLPTHGVTSNVEASGLQLTFMRIAKALFRSCTQPGLALLVITTSPASAQTAFLPHHCARAGIQEAVRRLRDAYPRTNSVHANLVYVCSGVFFFFFFFFLSKYFYTYTLLTIPECIQ